VKKSPEILSVKIASSEKITGILPHSSNLDRLFLHRRYSMIVSMETSQTPQKDRTTLSSEQSQMVENFKHAFLNSK
jgi:hypothetical protein